MARDQKVDGRSIAVSNVYTVNVDRTANGVTNNSVIHLGVDNGVITYFSDCGNPK